MSWYTDSVSILNQVLGGAPLGASEKVLRKLARDAYPYGERKRHPYKMWLKATKHVIATRTKMERWAKGANVEVS